MEFAQGRDASFYHSGFVRLSDARALWRAGAIRQWRKLLGRRGAGAGSDPEPPFRLGLLRRGSGGGRCRIRNRTVLPKKGECILPRRTEAIMVLARAVNRCAAVMLGTARSFLPARLRAPVFFNHPQPVQVSLPLQPRAGDSVRIRPGGTLPALSRQGRRQRDGLAETTECLVEGSAGLR